MKIERPLGPNEKMTWLLDQAAPMNFVIVARIEGDLNPDACKDSLVALTGMHPLLTARIELRGETPWVVNHDQARPSLRVMERSSETQWHAEMEHELNTPFNCYQDPLLRVTLIRSATVSELLFTFYHSISDANSGVYALRDFLTLVSNWKPGVAPIPPVSYPIRPAVEELLPPAARGWSKFRKTIALIGKQIVSNFADRPRKLEVVDTPRRERVTKVIHQTLPKELVEQILTNSRKHQTTVQGALCAALLSAISRRIESGEKLTLSCCQVVNLRNNLDPQLGDEIGMLASGVITAHQLRPTPEFWTLAREIKEQLNRGIESGEIYITMTLVGGLIPKSSPPDAFADKITEVFSYASIVTNIGKVEIPEEYGKLKLKQLHFAVSLKNLAGKEFNLAAATFGEQMSLNFIYTAPNLAAETAEGIAGDMVGILKENL